MDCFTDNECLINAVSNYAPKVRLLRRYLANGADINYQTMEQGVTPLMIAAQTKYDRVVEYLLRLGANPLVKNNEHQIASALISKTCTIYPMLKDFELLFAALNNELVLVEDIISEGALVNFKAPDGKTALQIAVALEFEEMVELLLLYGAKPVIAGENEQNIFKLTTNQNIHALLENALDEDNNVRLMPKMHVHRFFAKS